MSSQLILESPRRDHHLDVLGDVFARTFSAYWDRFESSRESYFDASPYDWDASRIGIVDGEVVSHFGVWDFGMRIGSCVTRMAGIGAVATLKTMRGQGVMARTARECIDGLRPAGYDLTLLFGIPDFYHRFGYVVSFPEADFLLQTRDIPQAERPPKSEVFTGDPTELAEQYNVENQSVTGTYVRPTFRRVRKPGSVTCRRFETGYVWAGRDGNTLVVADCAGEPADVVAVVRSMAVDELAPEVNFSFLPRRSRVGEYLQTLSHTYKLRHGRTGGPMFRIINIVSLFEKIADELSRRVNASPMSDYTGTIRLTDADEGVVLSIRDGAIVSVQRAEEPADNSDGDPGFDGEIAGGVSLVRLVVGDGDPARVCAQGGVTTSGDATYLLPILFPDQEPSTPAWDRF